VHKKKAIRRSIASSGVVDEHRYVRGHETCSQTGVRSSGLDRQGRRSTYLLRYAIRLNRWPNASLVAQLDIGNQYVLPAE